MKRVSTIAMISAVVLAPMSASATDIYDGRHDDAYPVQGSAVNWSGFYVGGQIGYGNANHDLTLSEYFKDYCFDAPKAGTDPDTGEELQVQPDDAFETNKDFGALRPGLQIARVTAVPEGGCAALNTAPVGPNAGYATVPGDSRNVANIDGINSHGVIGGFQAGYDQQVYNWVLGAFGLYNFSGMETTANFEDFSAKIEKDDEWTIGIRAGHLLGERTLLYGLLGYTQTDYNFTTSPDVDGLKNNVTFDGITFGAGLEHAVTQNVFLGIEGTHTIYGEETIFDSYDADLNTGAKVTDDLSETRVMGTLKIKLNSF